MEDPMKLLGLSAIVATAIVMVATTAAVQGDPVENKGTTPYVTHFIFRPVMNLDVPGLGSAVQLEAIGTTENMKGEKMFDKMSAHCAALKVDSGDKHYIDGACVLADNDGDTIFSTFDTREVDKSQPDMSCGTHTITGGTGKYNGITGSEPLQGSALAT
jgi:GH25 family lysozyme M1 (1,4-beta-N-acetylmuramidase)